MFYIWPTNHNMEWGNIDIDVVHRWDDTSLTMLYSHFYKALVAFSMQMVDQLEVAEEIVQDTFVSLWQQRNTFKSEGTLRAYLYNTVRNKSISYLRHEKVEQQRIEVFEREYRLMHNETDSETNREELFRQLLLGIEALPQKLRQLFLMSIAGKTSEDIASELGISLDSVKKQRQRGLKKLRKHLHPDALLLLLTLVD